MFFLQRPVTDMASLLFCQQGPAFRFTLISFPSSLCEDLKGESRVYFLSELQWWFAFQGLWSHKIFQLGLFRGLFLEEKIGKNTAFTKSKLSDIISTNYIPSRSVFHGLVNTQSFRASPVSYYLMTEASCQTYFFI